MAQFNEKSDINKKGLTPETVLAVHDLSCFGRCALTVVAPTLCAMGLQAVPLPTALLSTHTGGFDDFTFLDLEDEMKRITAHWRKLGLHFDALYSGFLGNAAQCGLVGNMKKWFSPSVMLVDPVLGDDGELYRTVTVEQVEKMRELCAVADIITPNLTEAAYLTGTSCPSEGNIDCDTVRILGEKLLSFGPHGVVITGLPVEEDGMEKMGTAVFRGEAESGTFIKVPRLEARYPGTGDLFASVLLGKYMNGCTLEAAAEGASRFVWEVMRGSAEEASGSSIADNRTGVGYEKYLRKLVLDHEKN